MNDTGAPCARLGTAWRVNEPEKEHVLELQLAHCTGSRVSALFAAVLLVAWTPVARAQDAPAAGPKPPDDSPSIKFGVTLFADYTYQQKPAVTDADGNVFNPSSFNVTRTYLNFAGQLSHLLAFRVTPDITRETGEGSSLAGSLTYRVKYAYGQVNLDDWLPKGSWVRFGIVPTLFVDSVEPIYRYRFQGGYFTEREGFTPTSDAGVTARTAFPGSYGDVQVGLYNGEGYQRTEANDQKSLQGRVGVRPLPGHSWLSGWRVQGFYNHDHVVRSADRTRAIFNTTFENPYLNAGFDYVRGKDQASAASNPVETTGLSVWATPRIPRANGASWEALLRHDRVEVTTVPGGRARRTIAGAAYWFARQGGVSAAVMLDIEQVAFEDFLPERPAQRRFAVHTLVAF